MLLKDNNKLILIINKINNKKSDLFFLFINIFIKISFFIFCFVTLAYFFLVYLIFKLLQSNIGFIYYYLK